MKDAASAIHALALNRSVRFPDIAQTCRAKLLQPIQMATKALLYSPDKLTFEKRKVTACESLVVQLLAVKLAKHVYQRVIIKSSPTLRPEMAHNEPVPVKRGYSPGRYIPQHLPSHKTPGTRAIGPVVERSRERLQLIHAAKHPQIWNPIERSGVSAINPIM